MEEGVEKARALAGRAAGLYSKVLDRLEAALDRMPLTDVGAEHIAPLVGILRGAELAGKAMERLKGEGGDVARTLLDLIRGVDLDEIEGSPFVSGAPAADEAEDGADQEDQGDAGPDPVAGAGGPGRDGEEGGGE